MDGSLLSNFIFTTMMYIFSSTLFGVKLLHISGQNEYVCGIIFYTMHLLSIRICVVL